MSKRGNTEGSIYRRKSDGRWVAAMTCPNGKRKYFYSKTRKDVARKLTLALKALGDGLPVLSDQIRVGQFLSHWLEICKPTVRPSTWRRYEQLVRTHVVPFIGNLRLTRLEPSSLQRLYADRLKSGLAPATVAHLHRVLHHAFDQAMRWGHAARNVASLVTPPRPRRHEMTVLSADQARSLIIAACGSRFEALYALALSTGMRQGELLALRWQDLDMEQGRIEVNHTLAWTEDGFQLAEPKTARSRRQVQLSKSTVESLRRHKTIQAKERLRCGEAWEINDLIFPNEIGRPVQAGNLLRRSFFPLLEKAGLPKIRFHDLRHSAATLLLTKGIHPKIVSEMLGHATISVTLDLYSHVTPDMQKEAALAMDEVFGG